MKLTLTAFTKFLANNKNHTAWTTDSAKCPLARYLNSISKNKRWYIGSKTYSHFGTTKIYDLPNWAQLFVQHLDDSYQRPKRIKLSRALGILNTLDKRGLK